MVDGNVGNTPASSPASWMVNAPKGDTGAAGAAGAGALTIVRVVSTTATNPSTDYTNGATIDGVTLATNDLVLRASTSLPELNGVYVVVASGSASRHTSLNTFDSICGVYFSVMEGTTNADSFWKCTADKGGTLGTTALTIVAASDGMTAAERQNAALILAYQSKFWVGSRRILNQFADGYASSNGVDAGNSSNYTVDTAVTRIINTTTTGSQISTSGTTKTGSYTANGGLASAFDGVTSQTSAVSAVTPTSTAGYNNTISVDWGVGVTKTVARFKVFTPTDSALLGGGGGSTLKLQGSTNNSTWVDLYTSGTVLATNGSSIDVSSGIDTSTAYRYHRINVNGNGTNGSFIAEIQFFAPSVTNNLTLVTTAQTADASVSKARILLEIDESISAPVLNTDITAEVTCDGGSHWASASLTDVGAGQGGRRIGESGEIVCTAGTSFAARIKTFNNKQVPIYALNLAAQ
jgi:hypothetical protein